MRTLVLIDGQNLYHLAKNAWSSASEPQYNWPSYDVEKLARTLVAMNPERILTEIRFYSGVQKRDIDPFWHGFWSNKLRYLKSKGIQIYRGRINNAGKEKGVDVQLALDLIRATYQQQYDVAIIVSQDNDFAPLWSWLKKLLNNNVVGLLLNPPSLLAPEARQVRVYLAQRQSISTN